MNPWKATAIIAGGFLAGLGIAGATIWSVLNIKHRRTQ